MQSQRNLTWRSSGWKANTYLLIKIPSKENISIASWLTNCCDFLSKWQKRTYCLSTTAPSSEMIRNFPWGVSWSGLVGCIVQCLQQQFCRHIVLQFIRLSQHISVQVGIITLMGKSETATFQVRNRVKLFFQIRTRCVQHDLSVVLYGYSDSWLSFP